MYAVALRTEARNFMSKQIWAIWFLMTLSGELKVMMCIILWGDDIFVIARSYSWQSSTGLSPLYLSLQVRGSQCAPPRLCLHLPFRRRIFPTVTTISCMSAMLWSSVRMLQYISFSSPCPHPLVLSTASPLIQLICHKACCHYYLRHRFPINQCPFSRNFINIATHSLCLPSLLHENTMWASSSRKYLSPAPAHIHSRQGQAFNSSSFQTCSALLVCITIPSFQHPTHENLPDPTQLELEVSFSLRLLCIPKS